LPAIYTQSIKTFSKQDTPMGFFLSKNKTETPSADASLPRGLSKTKESLLKRLQRVIAGRTAIDEDTLDNLEETLIAADVGVESTLAIIERIQKRAAKDKFVGTAELQTILREEIMALLCENPQSTADTPDTSNPYVIMVVGVNGAGKTTTIGKLAAQFAAQGKKVYIGAADTFRAAAIEQLETWAQRSGAVLIKQKPGADPAAVAFDTICAGKAHSADVVLIDTAGRLHNKINLMNELAKIRSVMGKVVADAPHETLLVLDGSTGQNAYQQAQEFTKAAPITALAITKLDGTAKGGVVIGISAQFHVPIKYIGVGERVEDLQIFDRQKFVDALFN
jgi:fused signal recognition particle receptor